VVENIQGICATILQVNEISSSIAAAVGEQGAATQEIAASVQRAASGTNSVSQNITSVTSATTQTGEVAHAVLQSSEKLSGKLQVLQREVSEFVSGLRAA
jgi:methyl-accepting chemotaxis protein